MVLTRIFRKPAPMVPPSVPHGMRVYAVGDIHGRLDCLDRLLAMIERDRADGPGETRLVFLGDLIDRGPDSSGVVDRLMALHDSDPTAAFIMGNHEELLLHGAEGSREALGTFDRVGGRATLLSYGVDADVYDHSDLRGMVALIQAHVPESHLSFLRSFVDRVSIGDYRFVHAGVRPGVPFDEQRGGDLRWIRREFLEHDGAFDGFVIHGHTVTSEIDERANRIGIDTGAFASGRLSAIVLEGETRRYLATELLPA